MNDRLSAGWARNPWLWMPLIVFSVQIVFTAVIRLYVEPVLRPQTHWAYGLTYASDSKYFYEQALNVRTCLASEGWRACAEQDWPGGGHVFFIGALLYVARTANPWVVFVANACVSCVSSLLLAWMLRALGFQRGIALSISTLLAVTPLWLYVHSELLREPLVVCAVFASLLALTMMMARQGSVRGWRPIVSDGFWVALLTAATDVVVQLRPYLLLPLVVAFGAGVAVRAGAEALRGRRYASQWRPVLVSIAGLMIVMLAVVAPERARVHTYTDRADLNGDVVALVNARRDRVRLARERADAENAHLSRDEAIQLTAPCTVPWQAGQLPTALDQKLQALSCNRQEFQRWCDETVLGKGADRNCDMAVLASTSDVIRHLPVALSFGLLTPYPNMWLAGFGSGGTGIRRAGYVIDGVLAYACLTGLVPLVLWQFRTPPAAVSLATALMVMLLIYGLSVPTQFILARMRLSLYIPLLAIGASVWVERFLPAVSERTDALRHVAR